MTALKSPFAGKPMTRDAATDLTSVLKALADPARLRLLSLIHAQADSTVADLTAHLELTQPTISHHVSKLEAAGLVSRRKDGVWSRVALCPDAFAEIAALLKPVRR